MPYSKKQQKAAQVATGMARSGKTGGSGPAAQMARSMSAEQLHDFATGPIEKPKKMSIRMKKK